MIAALWTSLLYLAIGAGLLALLGRVLGRLSLAEAGALLLLPLCFTGGALVSGDSYGGAALAYQNEPLASHRAELGMDKPLNPALTDVHGVVIPWRAAARWSWSRGEWPLWNPFAGCGEPLAGSAQPAPYSFVELVTLAAPLAQSFTLSVSLVFLIAAAGAHLLAAHLGCRPQAAFIAAAAFAFCNYLAFWNAWPLGATVAWLPLVVLAGRRLIAAPGPARAATLAAVLAQVLLAGHPESALHVVVLGAACGGAALLERRRAPAAPIGAVLGWASAGGALALGLAAIFLLPVADTLLQSHEWKARGSTHAVIHQTDWDYTRGALLADAAHFAFGLPGRGESAARPAWLIPGSSLYLGALVFPLAALGLLRSRQRSRWWLLVLLVFGVLAGAKVPGFFPLLGKLPLFSVSLNERLVFAASFALAVLAALGVEAVLAAGRRRELAGWLAATAVVYGALFAWLLPNVLAQGVPRPVVVAQSLAAVLPLALGSALLAATRLPARVAVAALLGLLLAARVVEAGWMYDRTPDDAFYPRVPPLERLAPIDRREQPFRVVGFGQALLPNQATLYGLEDVRTYNALHLDRFVETWPLWTERAMGFWFLQVSDLQNPFLAFLNARFLIADKQVPRVRPWTREAGAVGVRLYRNRRVLPRAFLPRRVLPAGERAATLAAMAAETDFAARAWIEHPSLPPEGRANGEGAVTARRRGPGYELEVDLPAERWIVISETAWRGWRATARRDPDGGDGLDSDRRLEIAFANHAFLGVRAPAGRYRIDLDFRPRSHTAGLTVSAASLAVLAALGWAGRRRRGAQPSGSALSTPSGAVPSGAVKSSPSSAATRGATSSEPSRWSVTPRRKPAPQPMKPVRISGKSLG